jgi:hypothetical protein
MPSPESSIDNETVTRGDLDLAVQRADRGAA